jgi:hypothetical protein
MTIVADDELTRFIRPKQKRYIMSDGGVRTAAFSTGSDGKVSVFVTSNMSLNDIWNHGDLHFPHEIIGRAYLKAQVVFDEGLGIDFNNIPPKHADIIGFPDAKDLNLAKRQALAAKAKFNKR